MRLIALFNLKPGVDPQAYTQWAKTVDLPTVNGLASVDSFRVFKSTGVLGSDATPPYQYVEIIDVADMDQFGADVSTELMQKVAAQFGEMVDVTFLTTEEICA
ncbi:REDY-like protein HapK [Novosphingobium sp. FSY-8]|uniref:REDY-like protein HapK n=1 Tax=Novosphingobium ovatum TaxID=1908523 RepID=A0ABW9XBY1_9SPHN|nr:REDY-like protein HapK [Novosphingobium ovatum]NBC36018.1 REDY-like protein HapK [Novosphingobium ovatum]